MGHSIILRFDFPNFIIFVVEVESLCDKTFVVITHKRLEKRRLKAIGKLALDANNLLLAICLKSQGGKPELVHIVHEAKNLIRRPVKLNVTFVYLFTKCFESLKAIIVRKWSVNMSKRISSAFCFLFQFFFFLYNPFFC